MSNQAETTKINMESFCDRVSLEDHTGSALPSLMQKKKNVHKPRDSASRM